jgi:RNase P/RNase MRP subunit POP5
MANAKTDEREVMVPSTEKVYVLTLTEDEAQYLSALLGSKVVGGGEARQLNSAIWNALASEVGDYALASVKGQIVLSDDSQVYPISF